MTDKRQSNQQKPNMFMQTYALRKTKFKNLHKITHATIKIMYTFIGPVLRKGSNRLKLYTILFACSLGV